MTLHALLPIVTWTSLIDREKPLPVIVNTIPPLLPPDDGEMLAIAADDVNTADEITSPTPTTLMLSTREHHADKRTDSPAIDTVSE